MKKYVGLAIAIVIIYFFQSFFNATGGIGADSLSYFGIASDFPTLKTNLFPLGFPLMLKFFHWIFQDYFWAGKMLNISMVIVILIFSYFKKFYFRETVLLFAGKTLFYVLNLVISEGSFIFLLYFLIYLFHERFQEKINPRKFIILAALLLVLLITVRYSGIYIYLGVAIFFLMMILKNKENPLIKDLFLTLFFSGIGIGCYLGFNSYIYRSFAGENLRGAPAHYYAVYFLRDLLGFSNVIDPFIGIKPSSNSVLSISFQIGLMVFDLILLRYFIKLFKGKKDSLNVEFHYLLWIVAGVHAFAVFISGYFQQIEEMNVRMLAASNFILFFSFLIIYFKNLKSDKFIFQLGCFFLIFLTLYSLKMPVNYFNNRNKIESQMSSFTGKKYLFNDEKEGEGLLTTYEIPILKKSFQYKHTNNQRGEIKQAIAGTINPKIKWLKYDTIKNKSLVLYTSQLILK